MHGKPYSERAEQTLTAEFAGAGLIGDVEHVPRLDRFANPQIAE
jgi:hypothetical protein